VTTAGLDELDAIASIADPVDRAVRLRLRAKERNTLSGAESDLYRATIAEIRRAAKVKRDRTWIADLLGITPGGVTRLLTPKSRATASEGVAS
jgi:hypothetical protein